MNFKIFLLSLGLIFFYSSQLRAQCPDAIDDNGINKNFCFETYAENGCLEQRIIKNCLLAFSEESPRDPFDAPESPSTSLHKIIIDDLPNLTNENKSKIRIKTIKVYCNNKFCPNPSGILSKIICGKLKKIIDSIDGNTRNRSDICERISVQTDDCESDDRQCICEKKPDAPQCQGARRAKRPSTTCQPVDTNCWSTNENTELDPTANNEPDPTTNNDNDNDNDNDSKDTVNPLGKPDNDFAVSPFGRMGGGGTQSVDPSSFGGGTGYSAPSASGGTISGSRARVPGARVGEPGDISTQGGAYGFIPRGILQFPIRGEPGGNGGNNGNGGRSPSGPGARGGGPPAGLGGGAAGAGSSSSKNRRRRRRSAPKQNTRYMGSPGGGGRKGYSPKYSSMNRRIQKKMEENKKKISAKDINTFFQREMRRRGVKEGPQSFTPVFYFPDIERAYDELKGQNQFLNEKGNNL